MSIEEGKEILDKLRGIEKELARDKECPERMISVIKSLGNMVAMWIAFEEKCGENIKAIEEAIKRELEIRKGDL